MFYNTYIISFPDIQNFIQFLYFPQLLRLLKLILKDISVAKLLSVAKVLLLQKCPSKLGIILSEKKSQMKTGIIRLAKEKIGCKS